VIRLLLDQGLPRSTVELLRADGWDVVHACECSLSTARDEEILEYARTRAMYEPMLAARRACGGHSQAVSEDPGQGDSGQVDPGLTSCHFADAILLPAIRQYGRFDQEAVTR
jgi:hypothetical protein